MAKVLAALNRISLKHIGYLIVLLKASLVLFIILQLTLFSPGGYSLSLDSEFLWYCLAGFVAQLIDGALGMAYGVSCSTLLMQFGIPPAVATASVHTAEVFTTGASGLSHLWMKNVNKKLLIRLATAGILGAVIGAFIISKILDGDWVKPYIAGYLMLIGATLVYKSFRKKAAKKEVKRVGWLGFFGGMFDAIGGGGWGPFVSSNLIIMGRTPRITIGTVNTAEFFITFCSTGVFLFLVGVDSWKVILGLVAGGIVSAPIAAWAAGRIKAKLLMLVVGLAVIITSAYTIYKIIAG